MRKLLISLLGIGILLLTACDNTPPKAQEEHDHSHGHSHEKSEYLSDEEGTANVSAVNLNNISFDFKVVQKEENEQGIPKVDIYIVPSNDLEELFLVEEVAGVEIERDRFESFDIPSTAIMAIECYFAGGGNYYYVSTSKNVMTVHRGLIMEPNPDVEETEPSYQLFKRFSFYEEEIIKEEFPQKNN